MFFREVVQRFQPAKDVITMKNMKSMKKYIAFFMTFIFCMVK